MLIFENSIYENDLNPQLEKNYVFGQGCGSGLNNR